MSLFSNTSSTVRLGIIFCAALATDAKAVPLTWSQTTTLTFGGSGIGSGSGHGSGGWIFAPFSTSVGNLLSVQFDARVNATVSAFDRNVFNAPETWSPFVLLNTEFYFPSFFFSQLNDSARGTSSILVPGATGAFSSDFSQSFSHVFTSGADLANFSGLGLHLAEVNSAYFGSGEWGGVTGTETAALTLTYTYDVPESGSSLLLLTISLVLLAFGRRLRPAGFAFS